MPQKITLANQVRPGLVLNPSMQLALRFLQVPALELRDLIQRELAENPALEIDEEEAAGPSADAAAAEADSAPASQTEPREEGEVDDWQAEERALLPRGLQEADERGGWPDGPAAPSGGTLAGHLLPQLRLATRDPDLLELGEYLIGCLDDRGYLGCSLAEAAESAGVAFPRMENALSLLQGLEPAGIAARDLRECLLLQLAARGRAGGLAWRIVRDHLDLLGAARHARLRRILAVPGEEFDGALKDIRRLHPHPGHLVAGDDVRYIYPDLIVEAVGCGFEVHLDERAVPRLRISGSCRDLIGSETGDVVSRRYALTRLRSARWLMAAMDRRRRTMLRVMHCILETQEGFFRRGPLCLRPLTLGEVAGRLGVHESTVARVIRSKYVQTPRGIYPLKYFFSNRMPTVSGEDTSGRAVRERIRSLIEQEDRSSPLSDETIAGILGSTGVKIARRTVAKYRSSLKIERALLRRTPASAGPGGRNA